MEALLGMQIAEKKETEKELEILQAQVAKFQTSVRDEQVIVILP